LKKKGIKDIALGQKYDVFQERIDGIFFLHRIKPDIQACVENLEDLSTEF
jgi:hypothetical protein